MYEGRVLELEGALAEARRRRLQSMAEGAMTIELQKEIDDLRAVLWCELKMMSTPQSDQEDQDVHTTINIDQGNKNWGH